MNAVFVRNTAVMPRRYIVRAEFLGVFFERTEFYFTIAKHVGVRRSSAFILFEEIGKHPVHILFGEIHAVVRNVEFSRHSSHVGVIVLGGTAAVLIVLFPVFHKQTDHVITLLFQKKGGDRTIHAPAHTDNDRFFTHTRLPTPKITRTL